MILKIFLAKSQIVINIYLKNHIFQEIPLPAGTICSSLKDWKRPGRSCASNCWTIWTPGREIL